MTLIITNEDFCKEFVQLEHSGQIQHQSKPRNQGYRRVIDLCAGMSFVIDDYNLQEDLIIEVPDCEPFEDLELSFMILGNNRNEGVNSGHNFFSAGWSKGNACYTKFQAGERILKFDIHLELPLFQTLIDDRLDQLPLSLVQAILDEGKPEFWDIAATTPTAFNIVHQIMNCPYHGLTRRLYLESKALELIALRLEQLEIKAPSSSNLKSVDIERIYFAADILTRNFDKPPSLLELSRMVGLNDCTLKKGFRQVFGTTAFGYLHDYRLEKARQLLSVGNIKVQDIVHRVGFSDGSYFAAAFRKKFGVNPSFYAKHGNAAM